MLAEGQQAAAVRESMRATGGKLMTFLRRELAMDAVHAAVLELIGQFFCAERGLVHQHTEHGSWMLAPHRVGMMSLPVAQRR